MTYRELEIELAKIQKLFPIPKYVPDGNGGLVEYDPNWAKRIKLSTIGTVEVKRG